MPPNSRYFDKFERHRSTKQFNSQTTKADLQQLKKNYKFKNSTTQFNDCKQNVETEKGDDLKNCKNVESIDLAKGTKNLQQTDCTQCIQQQSKNCKFKNSSYSSDCRNIFKKFSSKFVRNTCLSIRLRIISNSTKFTCYAFVSFVCILIYLPCIYNEFVFR